MGLRLGRDPVPGAHGDQCRAPLPLRRGRHLHVGLRHCPCQPSKGPEHLPAQLQPALPLDGAYEQVFRDWFLLQLRRGITTNDQDPLSLAETRQAKAGGLRVGQVPTEFAGAFYSPVGGAFYPRITRVLHGPAQVIHVGPSMGPGWCAAFNDHAGKPRQMVVQNASVQGRPLTFLIQRGRDGDRTALMDGNKSLFANVTETEGCRAALGVGPPRMKIRRCSYQLPREMRQMRSVMARPQLVEAAVPTKLSIKY